MCVQIQTTYRRVQSVLLNRMIKILKYLLQMSNIMISAASAQITTRCIKSEFNSTPAKAALKRERGVNF